MNEGRGPGKHTSGSISFTQAILLKKFLKHKELEELHKHQSGEYVDYHSEEFWAKRKAEGKAVATGTVLPDDLAFMSIVARDVRCRLFYGAGSEASCCANILRRMEATVLSVSDAFDEYMRRFTEQNHLVYILPPPMLDLVRVAMGTGALTSLLSPAMYVEAPILDVAIRFSSTPSPSIRARGIDDVPSPPPPSSDPRTD
ncbi:hypothetical protein M9H77_30943 [Catharanthus roseus]|uniref:Uncharacterized protein n=1 Tax=Catharanthus roseus TaxID=4058 RepID=A0ACB9ZZ32_CATRO|nr:hypothetical protein M9H77_30943 [Catharanthus roseus]